jgi:septum formation topological specificity factor MinE
VTSDGTPFAEAARVQQRDAGVAQLAAAQELVLVRRRGANLEAGVMSASQRRKDAIAVVERHVRV